MIIDHDRVLQQIFNNNNNNNNNKDKCVPIRIQKLNFAIIVKHFHFIFFFVSSLHFFFALSLVYTHQNNAAYHDFLFATLPVFLHSFFSYDRLLILFVFRLSFRFCNSDLTPFFYDIHSTRPNFFNIYIFATILYIKKKERSTLFLYYSFQVQLQKYIILRCVTW